LDEKIGASNKEFSIDYRCDDEEKKTLEWGDILVSSRRRLGIVGFNLPSKR
jgi:hypothetical protein